MISIVIPTFNRFSLVTRAVESVLCQSFEEYEVYVIDDGSTDDTQTASAVSHERRKSWRRNLPK